MSMENTLLAPVLAAPRRRGVWQVRIAVAIVALLALFIVAAPFIAPHDPDLVDLAAKLQGPSAAHWLGTDHLGRDMLTRLIYATRISLGSVAIILLLVLALGIIVGGASGFIGGRFDRIVMRFCDVFLTFPTFVLAMFMIGVLGIGMVNVIAAVVLSHWAWYARIVRGLVLSMRERDYIAAAEIAGAGRVRIFTEHIMPGVLAQLLVLATLDIGHMMMHVAGLSFLGLGVAAPTPEWGVMINDARQFVWTQPLLVLWPGMMILISVMAFNRLGDALRDRLDPAFRIEHC
ncbi:nickel ABC transporter permease subunit NikC [Taklimakanibacter albus]|uniref:Nickel ABC transporter permease subunit NikC n=1 Tax=Taklimakanibacter albus TaxID=2800327 RepID=A0ACC5RE41_9HYPH|nr:nickel ABC transporter permease subunit NikC [Aestuariivirga sp. YIM B02566]MBK1870859.1 nickel ABC transporter permease subunit NikC [Aestuariivirga sp. YIM B02566]